MDLFHPVRCTESSCNLISSSFVEVEMTKGIVDGTCSVRVMTGQEKWHGTMPVRCRSSIRVVLRVPLLLLPGRVGLAASSA